MFATKSFLIAIANRLTEISEECIDIETKEKLDELIELMIKQASMQIL